jgi:hypothetical protein
MGPPRPPHPHRHRDLHTPRTAIGLDNPANPLTTRHCYATPPAAPDPRASAAPGRRHHGQAQACPDRRAAHHPRSGKTARSNLFEASTVRGDCHSHKRTTSNIDGTAAGDHVGSVKRVASVQVSDTLLPHGSSGPWGKRYRPTSAASCLRDRRVPTQLRDLDRDDFERTGRVLGDRYTTVSVAWRQTPPASTAPPTRSIPALPLLLP